MCHSSCRQASPLSLGTAVAAGAAAEEEEVDLEVFDVEGGDDRSLVDAPSLPPTFTHASSSPPLAAAAAATSAEWRAAMRLTSSSVESQRAATSSSSSSPIESRSIVFEFQFFFVVCFLRLLFSTSFDLLPLIIINEKKRTRSFFPLSLSE